MSYVGLDSRSMVRGAAEIDMSWLKVISYISDQTFNPSLKVRLRTTKRHTRIFHLNLFQIDKDNSILLLMFYTVVTQQEFDSKSVTQLSSAQCH